MTYNIKLMTSKGKVLVIHNRVLAPTMMHTCCEYRECSFEPFWSYRAKNVVKTGRQMDRRAHRQTDGQTQMMTTPLRLERPRGN